MACFCCGSRTAIGAPPSLVEVKLKNQTIAGKVIAHNDRLFWLLGRDGVLHRLETGRVESYRQIASQFQSWSMSIVRDQLRRELGSGYAVTGSRHYLVCARDERVAGQYAELLEDLFRSFHLYFSVRGFKVPEPDFPLVAIVFPNHAAFARYAKNEQIPVGASLRGYYLASSNRIALFEGDVQPPAMSRLPLEPEPLIAGNPFTVPHDADSDAAWCVIETALQDTLIHEATHQVAFNSGLHTRVGTNPKWVVEGLATVFEAPGIRNSSANLAPRTRINSERFLWFGNFCKSRRAPKSLEAFVSDDRAFDAAVLDGYSQAWALTFFLIETRSRQYAGYLSAIARRDPLTAYPPAERLADFQKAFGSNTALLEAEFLRFLGGIK